MAAAESLGVLLDQVRSSLAHEQALSVTLQARVESLMATPPDTIVRVAAPETALGTFGTVLLGGALATLGGIAAQAFRGWLEDERSRRKLIRRMRGTLEVCISSTRTMLKSDHTKPISPPGLKRIRRSWRNYDRLSDDLVLLGDHELVLDVESSLDLTEMVTERLLGEEDQFRRTRRELGTFTPDGLKTKQHVEEGIQEHRKKLLKMLDGLRLDAERVLQLFNQKWPPPPGHGAKFARIAAPSVPPMLQPTSLPPDDPPGR